MMVEFMIILWLNLWFGFRLSVAQNKHLSLQGSKLPKSSKPNLLTQGVSTPRQNLAAVYTYTAYLYVYFLFYNDGWLKDGDLNTANGQTVEPLPFHGMTSYPEGAYNQYPVDNELEKYRKKYNTRDITTEDFKSLLKYSDY